MRRTGRREPKRIVEERPVLERPLVAWDTRAWRDFGWRALRDERSKLLGFVGDQDPRPSLPHAPLPDLADSDDVAASPHVRARFVNEPAALGAVALLVLLARPAPAGIVPADLVSIGRYALAG
jgi:hypothetical protein